MLRDELDCLLIQYCLVESYQKFVQNNIAYPFVEMRELKPRAIIPDVEHDLHNNLLLIFSEDSIPNPHKKYIRFFDDNKLTKENLLKMQHINFYKDIPQNLKMFESMQFSLLLKDLLPIDYALLIQRDPSVKSKTRYALSHFHVRIDWPITDAAEDLMRRLKYIQKDLYEKGDEHAENLQKKFFEYYGLHPLAGGRRTAAAIAAQYLKRVPYVTTVYVGSSESRSLTKISERSQTRYVLIQLDQAEIAALCSSQGIDMETFINSYLISKTEKGGVAIFQSNYAATIHAEPTEESKVRDLNMDYSWLTVKGQHLIPCYQAWDSSPLAYSRIYSA
ncbi:MAG: hypothetical protein V1753_05260 [Pseudomonadota bacterium]